MTSSAENRSSIWGLARLQETVQPIKQLEPLKPPKSKSKLKSNEKVTAVKVQLTPDTYIIARYHSGAEGGVRVASTRKQLPPEPAVAEIIQQAPVLFEDLEPYSTAPLPLFYRGLYTGIEPSNLEPNDCYLIF
jgi:hypothetical protein